MKTYLEYPLLMCKAMVATAVFFLGLGCFSAAAQSPEGIWYLDHVELNEASTDPMQTFTMEKLFKREEGHSYLHFKGDSLTYYSLMRGEIHYHIGWSGSNSYFVHSSEEQKAPTHYHIDWLAPDEMLITHSGNNSLSYYRKRTEDQ